MTPPSKAPGVSASADASVTATPPTPPEVKPAAKPAVDPNAKTEWVEDPSSDKQWVPSGSIGLLWGSQGGRNGSLLSIDSQSALGDYNQIQLNFALMRDLVGDKVRFRLGPRLDGMYTFGNENTGGSKYGQVTGGAQIEVDWTRVYGAGLFGFLKGPSYININGGIGYGGGTGTAETFSLHKQSGFATNLGLGVNVFNVSINSLQIGADFLMSTNGIFGGTHNSTGDYLGFGLTFRPSTKVKKVEVEKCEDVAGKITDLSAKNQQLRVDNAKAKDTLDSLKGILEQGDKPITTEMIQKALFLREVRIALITALPTTKEEDIRKGIKDAFNAKDDAATDEAIKKIPGVTDQILADAKNTDGAKRYPKGYDFWAQIPLDPQQVQIPDPLPSDCKELDKLYDKMWEENVDLNKRNVGINGRLDTAMLLDALKDHLGKAETKFLERAHGFVLDFVQPNFSLAKPDENDIKALREYAAKVKGTEVKPDNSELVKIAARMFQLPEWEMQNFSDLADKMNGKVDPSFTRAFKQGSSAKKFDPATQASDAEKKNLEWMKEITWFVEGHTDSQGGDDANQKLSERRAESAKLYLQIFGVTEDRLEAKGYGEQRLAVPEAGSYAQIQTAQTKNRRVVIRVKGEKTSAPVNPQGKTTNVDPTKAPPEGNPSDKPLAPKAPAKGGNPPPPPAKTNPPPANPPTNNSPPPKPPAKTGGGIQFDDN